MSSIKHFDFRRLDLNLLVTFDALMVERNVTRAAARLRLGQPAVSHALGRLRAFLNDPLFVATRRGLVPTRRAAELADWVRGVLEGAQSTLLQAPSFDPKDWGGVIRLGLPDTIEMVLMPQVLAKLAEAAPKARLTVYAASDWRQALDRLDDGVLDLYVGLATELKPWQHRRDLWDEPFLAMFSRAQLDLRVPMSLKDYLRQRHVIPTPREGSMEGRADRMLARIGRRRTVILSTPHFLALPHFLLETPAIATLHARPARRLAAAFGLETSHVPVDLGTVTESMVWHEMADRDPAQRWFRAIVAEVAALL